ncbi:MAG TPA: DoxX family membrane protein [Cyclobacteriaceae bacterium]|nr:DoxX family membrane protein [Cyclobacteriaceae bacterium]
MKTKTILSGFLRLVAAVILLQTLYFKFTGQPESIYIFSKVGMEPWGRIGSGVAELLASILLLVPATIVIGAFLAAGIMVGALAAHLFILGIEVRGDGGQLFVYALVVLIASIVLLFVHFQQLISFKKRFLKSH